MFRKPTCEQNSCKKRQIHSVINNLWKKFRCQFCNELSLQTMGTNNLSLPSPFEKKNPNSYQ